jgi:hypothetical protein
MEKVIEMPEHKQGESESDWMKRCVPYLENNEGKDHKQAVAQCINMYKEWREKNKATADYYESKGYKPVVFVGSEVSIDNNVKEINGVKYDVVKAVAAKSNIFYQNVWVNDSVLRNSVSQWEGTYNDFSHMATDYPHPFYPTGVENIEYITGFNSKGEYDESIGGVTVEMNISHNAPKYSAWKSFYDITLAAGKIPNVSIFGFANYKVIETKELPSGTVIPKGVSFNDKVVAMTEFKPIALTTCLKGKCDDKAGCGIISAYNCTDGKCNIKINQQEEKNEHSDSDKIKYLKNRINENKEK